MLIGCDSINNEREVGFWVIVLAWWYAWYCVVLFLFTLVSFISGVWVYVCHICVCVCISHTFLFHFHINFKLQAVVVVVSLHVKCLSWMTPPTDMIWLQQKVLNDQETATTPIEQNRSETKMMKTKATKMTMKATTAKSKLKIKTRFKRISHVNVLRWTYDARSRKNMHEPSHLPLSSIKIITLVIITIIIIVVVLCEKKRGTSINIKIVIVVTVVDTIITFISFPISISFLCSFPLHMARNKRCWLCFIIVREY